MKYDIWEATIQLNRMLPSLEGALDSTASLFEGRFLDNGCLGERLRTLAERLKPVVDFAAEISVNDSRDSAEYFRSEDLIHSTGRGLLAKVVVRAESLSESPGNDFDDFPRLDGEISLSPEDGEILQRLRLFQAVCADPIAYEAELEARGQDPGEFVKRLLGEDV